MTFHILHLTTPNISLYCEKGFLFCRYQDGFENKLPVDDLRAIIVATHQVSFTNSSLARLLENNIIILHCNDKYKPTGWSAGLDRVVRTKAFYNQIKLDKDLYSRLWKILLNAKINNQSNNLYNIGCKNHNLEKLINKPLANEANIAKQYWGKYFEALNVSISREHKNAESFENSCLNYGYAVISTLIYRSVLIHGLCPTLGIHHKEKYDSVPLIYDLVEPFRAMIDFYLYKFLKNNTIEHNHKEWCKYLADCLQCYRLQYKGKNFKIIDYVDLYIETLTRAFIDENAEELITPNIQEMVFQGNRV